MYQFNRIIGLLLVSLCTQVFADTLTLEHYLDYETVAAPQISPDGQRIVYTRRHIDQLNDRFKSHLWLMEQDGSRQRQLIEGSAPAWSPDGSRIAFLAADEQGRLQIFVRWMDAEGAVSQITRGQYGPRSFRWSPDSQSLAFVARVPRKSDWTVSLPKRPQGAKWTDDPVVIDTLHYRQDRVGYTNDGFDHLFVVPVTGGTARQLTHGDWNVGQRVLGVIATAPRLSWSPDSQWIAFDGPGKPIKAPNWFESHIQILAVETGEIKTLTSGHGVYGNPQFSPMERRSLFPVTKPITLPIRYLKYGRWALMADPLKY